MKRIYIASTKPEDWQRLLAVPKGQWKSGFSAKALAYCWENADGFPKEIARLFAESRIAAFQGIEALLILPEYKVQLPGHGKPSQNDVFVLAKAQGQLASIAVEAKVSEDFGPALENWCKEASDGKKCRLAFLAEQLGLPQNLPSDIRYQLLHRAASAVIEARKFNAKSAVMLVHSFGQDEQSFEDYRAFVKLLGASVEQEQLVLAKHVQGTDLYCGWVTGDAKYLNV